MIYTGAKVGDGSVSGSKRANSGKRNVCGALGGDIGQVSGAGNASTTWIVPFPLISVRFGKCSLIFNEVLWRSHPNPSRRSGILQNAVVVVVFMMSSASAVREYYSCRV